MNQLLLYLCLFMEKYTYIYLFWNAIEIKNKKHYPCTDTHKSGTPMTSVPKKVYPSGSSQGQTHNSLCSVFLSSCNRDKGLCYFKRKHTEDKIYNLVEANKQGPATEK